ANMTVDTRPTVRVDGPEGAEGCPAAGRDRGRSRRDPRSGPSAGRLLGVPAPLSGHTTYQGSAGAVLENLGTNARSAAVRPVLPISGRAVVRLGSCCGERRA